MDGVIVLLIACNVSYGGPSENVIRRSCEWIDLSSSIIAARFVKIKETLLGLVKCISFEI